MKIVFGTMLLGFCMTFQLCGQPFVDVHPLGRDGVVIPAEYFKNLRSPFAKNVTNFWTPPIDLIVKAETMLFPELQRQKATNDNRINFDTLISQLEFQRRQYVGIMMSGKRVLLINLFVPAPKEGVDVCFNWREEYVRVHDGGEMFWRTIFDDETQTFRTLEINSRSP